MWFSAQRSGHLGWFDPSTTGVELVALGAGSAPHGVTQGPDRAAWLTDGGQQAIVRVDWPSRELRLYKLPDGTPYANLNTCAFGGDGRLWFTGQSGVIGRVTPASGKVEVWDAPKGRGPYGICATPAGAVWYCSLAGSLIAQIDLASGASRVVQPPTAGQGARRVARNTQSTGALKRRSKRLRRKSAVRCEMQLMPSSRPGWRKKSSPLPPRHLARRSSAA